MKTRFWGKTIKRTEIERCNRQCEYERRHRHDDLIKEVESVKREVYTISVRDKVVAGWAGQGINQVGDIFTGAVVSGVTLVADETHAMFFVSRGVAEAVAGWADGEIEVYRHRGKLSEA